MNPAFGKYIIAVGIVLVLVGAVVYFFGDKLDWPDQLKPGRLPGDIRIEGKGGGFYFPIVTCIVISILLNLLIVLIRRFFG